MYTMHHNPASLAARSISTYVRRCTCMYITQANNVDNEQPLLTTLGGNTGQVWDDCWCKPTSHDNAQCHQITV